ncbi:unnamed protein product [Peronospora belbahrii]|uniref:Mid2 domain-containing protein n=1 Tax=Peronospora belbahrii TaxID=622444 RepID=A0AAU9L2Y9_9STRA|nr:unnamed protein product [Peronospora belbahrii]CAH0521070.1 unnamed protein product [Peronospora belbahrii]
MFRNLGVCMAVLMAILSNDVLVFTLSTNEYQNNSYATITSIKLQTVSTEVLPAPSSLLFSNAKPTVAPMLPTTSTNHAATSVVTNPMKETSHVSDCIPNFPNEKKGDPKTTTGNPALFTPSSVTADSSKPPETTPITPESADGSKPHMTTPITPESADGSKPYMTTPITPEGVASTASQTNDLSMYTYSNEIANQANTQSSISHTGTKNYTLSIFIVATIAAVAAVGIAASHIKKPRSVDDALVTPDDNEMIHIEIKRTPAGGSTIL